MSKIITGNCLDVLKRLPSRSVHCCVTSPPYWGLRDYGTEPVVWGDTPGCDHDWTPTDPPRYRTTGDAPNSPQQNKAACYDARKFNLCTRCGAWRGELGMEPKPCMFVRHLAEVFAEVWRVLRPDGTLWLNLGASYTARSAINDTLPLGGIDVPIVFRAKDLIPIPWLTALVLQQQGWFFRSDIIWNKPAATTESVEDRPSCTHEYITLLARDSRYYFDYVAIMTESKTPGAKGKIAAGTARARARGDKEIEVGSRARKRDVWTVSTSSFKGAHFATFPPDLIRPCILAGTSEKGCCPTCGAPWLRQTKKVRVPTRPGLNNKAAGKTTLEAGKGDPLRHITTVETIGWNPGCKCPGNENVVPCTVLDPFSGAATTGLVAGQHGRNFIGIDINPGYNQIALDRLRADKETKK